MEVRGHWVEVDFLPPLWASLGLNSDHQAWGQEALPAEPSHCPRVKCSLFPFLQNNKMFCLWDYSIMTHYWNNSRYVDMDHGQLSQLVCFWKECGFYIQSLSLPLLWTKGTLAYFWHQACPLCPPCTLAHRVCSYSFCHSGFHQTQ